jgi:hypothetical protein
MTFAIAALRLLLAPIRRLAVYLGGAPGGLTRLIKNVPMRHSCRLSPLCHGLLAGARFSLPRCWRGRVY